MAPEPVPNPLKMRLIEVGRKLLRPILKRLLASGSLTRALRVDPHIRMTGKAHYALRADVRFLKHFTKAWVWMQARAPLNTVEASYTHTSYDPAGVPKVERASHFAPNTVGRKPTRAGKRAGSQARSESEVRSDFRPHFRLFSGPSQKPAPKPDIDQVSDQVSGHASGLPPIVSVHLLPEAQAWLFGQVITRPSTTTLALESAAKPAVNAGGNAPKAGQIFVDLQYIAEILDAPDAVVSRLAVKLAQSRRADDGITPSGHSKDAHDMVPTPPKAPSLAMLRKRDLPPEILDWWDAITSPQDYCGPVQTHPPPSNYGFI